MTASIKALSDGLSGELQVGGNPSLRFGADTSGQLAGFRNKIINGDFSIWQRGSGLAVVGPTSAYTGADRWVANVVSGITCTATKATTFVGLESTYGSYYASFAFTGTGVSGSNVAQRIENVRTWAGKTVTLSFYCSDTVATQLNVSFNQFFGTGGSPSLTVSTAASPITITSGLGTRYSVTVTLPSIAGKTLGTNNDDYIEVQFVAAAANAHTFSLSRVQIEVGSIATPFEERPIGLELSLCQRYYEVLECGMAAGGATSCSPTFSYQVPKRTTPTNVTRIGAGTGGYTAPTTTTATAYSLYISRAGADAGGVFTISAEL